MDSEDIRNRFIRVAVDEVQNPTFELTKQYLTALDVEYENEQPKVARIKDGDQLYMIYFHVKGGVVIPAIASETSPEALVPGEVSSGLFLL